MQDIELHHWPVGKLIPYGRNPRKNDHVIEQMAGAIQEFGFRIPIIAKSSGDVVDGHLRLKAALHLGLETVPVVLAEANPALARLPPVLSAGLVIELPELPIPVEVPVIRLWS